MTTEILFQLIKESSIIENIVKSRLAAYEKESVNGYHVTCTEDLETEDIVTWNFHDTPLKGSHWLVVAHTSEIIERMRVYTLIKAKAPADPYYHDKEIWFGPEEMKITHEVLINHFTKGYLKKKELKRLLKTCRVSYDERNPLPDPYFVTSEHGHKRIGRISDISQLVALARENGYKYISVTDRNGIRKQVKLNEIGL